MREADQFIDSGMPKTRGSLPIGRADGGRPAPGVSDGLPAVNATRAVTYSASRARLRLAAGAVLAVLLLGLVTAAGASAFEARGSVEQIDVTGLTANAQMSLLNSHGKTLSTQSADSLGGLLFRNVKPGSDYKVRLVSNGESSEPITVHTQAAAPWIRKSTTSRSPITATRI